MRTKKQKILYYSKDRFYQKKADELCEVEEKVAWLLKHDERTRNDDLILLTEYWRIFDGFKAILLPLSEEQRQYMSNFESIRRTRQKLQELAKIDSSLSDFLPSENTQMIRDENRKAYSDYVIGG